MQQRKNIPRCSAGVSADSNVRRFMRLLVVAALLSVPASSLWVYPDELAYFNELAGGCENGHEHLLGSSLDWGQDTLRLIEWQRSRHSDGDEAVFFWLRCSYDARSLGLRGVDLHTPDWRETVLANSDPKETVTLMLSKQAMLQESRHLSKLSVERIATIGPTVVIVRAKCLGASPGRGLRRAVSRAIGPSRSEASF
ncbi:MAG TPA: hypothetical protein VFI31_10560 [Pirellulales bacterium]|nr:hypothetical protein [Pirellulales bacterium]